MQELTEKQKKVFAFIESKILTSHLPPTIREIAAELNFSSTGTVRDYLEALAKKGYLRRSNNKSRSLELATRQITGKIPIVAHITAGKPDMAFEDVLGYIDQDYLIPSGLSSTDLFALKVKGDSMVEAGICEGDIVILRKQAIASNGDIIAALIADTDEVTLKRIRYAEKKAFLEPANKNYQPIYARFSVIGKVITVIRKY